MSNTVATQLSAALNTVQKLKTDAANLPTADGGFLDSLESLENTIFSVFDQVKNEVTPSILRRVGYVPDQILSFFEGKTGAALTSKDLVTNLTTIADLIAGAEAPASAAASGGPLFSGIYDLANAFMEFGQLASSVDHPEAANLQHFTSMLGELDNALGQATTLLGPVAGRLMMNSGAYQILNQAIFAVMWEKAYVVSPTKTVVGFQAFANYIVHEFVPAAAEVQNIQTKFHEMIHGHYAGHAAAPSASSITADIVGVLEVVSVVGCRFVEDITSLLHALIQDTCTFSKDVVGVAKLDLDVSGGVAAGLEGTMKVGLVRPVNLVKGVIEAIFSAIRGVLLAVSRIAQSTRIGIGSLFQMIILIDTWKSGNGPGRQVMAAPA